MNDKDNFIPRHGTPRFFPADPEAGFQGGNGESRRKFLKRTGGATLGSTLAWIASSDQVKAQEDTMSYSKLLVCVAEPDEAHYEGVDPGSWLEARVGVEQEGEGTDFKVHTDQVDLFGGYSNSNWNDGIHWQMAHWLEFHDFPKRGDAKPASPSCPAEMAGNITAHVAIIRSSFSYSTYQVPVPSGYPAYPPPNQVATVTAHSRNSNSWTNHTVLHVTAPLPTSEQQAAQSVIDSYDPDSPVTEDQLEGLIDLVNQNGEGENLFKAISNGSTISYDDAEAASNVSGPHIVYGPDLKGKSAAHKSAIGWVFVTWKVKDFKLTSHAVFVPKWDTAANYTYTGNVSGTLSAGPASLSASIGLSTTVQENHPPASEGKILDWTFMNLSANPYSRLHDWDPPDPSTLSTLPPQDPFTLIDNS